MATLSGGQVNISSDPALASAGFFTFGNGAGNLTTIKGVYLGPIASASGVQCGFVDIRAVATVIARFYVFFTASAASQSDSVYFPLNMTVMQSATYRITYTAVTDATTAAVSVIWN